jgi:predicted metal-binding protein
MTLLICRTCPRYDVPANGEFRRALDAQIVRNSAADPNLIRHVQCLTGCPDDGVAALDGPGKARVRFTGLTGDHAAALVKAAHAHDASSTGAPEDWEIPVELVDHISTITFKRAPVSAAPSARPQTPFVWRRGAT